MKKLLFVLLFSGCSIQTEVANTTMVLHCKEGLSLPVHEVTYTSGLNRVSVQFQDSTCQVIKFDK